MGLHHLLNIPSLQPAAPVAVEKDAEYLNLGRPAEAYD